MEVTRPELAGLIGSTPDQVSKFIAEGLPVVRVGSGRGNHTVIDLRAALPWLLQRRSTAIDQERSRYFRLQSDKVQQEIRRRGGELVEASAVEHRWASMVVAARERLLAIPATLLQRNHIQAEHEDVVIGLIDEALSELAARGVHASA